MKKPILLFISIIISTFGFAQFPNLVASSNTPICIGSTLSLSAAHDVPPGGTTVAYSWIGPNGFTSNVQNPQRANANAVAGTYTITATFSGTYVGTHTATSTVLLSILPSVLLKSYLQNDNLVITSNFCVGNNMTLEAATDLIAGVTYAWTGPNGFTSNLKNPTILNLSAADAGIYQATVNFNNSSCVGIIKKNYEVTVGLAKLNLSSNSVCAGGNVTILPVLLPASATVSSYSWEGPNNFTSNANTLNINNLQETKTYKLTALMSGGCAGTAIAYTTISPNVPSPSIFSTINNCSASVTAFLSVTSAFTNYGWTGPNGFSSNLLSTPITLAGDYTFTGTITSAGCNDVFTRTITVPRIPVTTSPVLSVTIATNSDFTTAQNTFCDGTNVYLRTSTTGDLMQTMTYSWTGPNGFSSTLVTPKITNFGASNVGLYRVVITGTGNACSPSATATATSTIVIGQNTAPSIGISKLNSASSSTICNGNNVTLNAGLNNNSNNSIGTYAWTGPNGFTSNLKNPTIANINATNEGDYTVTATFVSGCIGTATASTNLTLSSTPSLSFSGRRLKFSNFTTTFNCLGSTIELIPQTTGSIINSINWTGPNGFSSTDVNPRIINATTANTGSYVATAVLGGECPATVAFTTTLTFSNTVIPFNIIKENIDPIGDNRSFCAGSNMKLVVIPNSATYYQGTYLWSGPNSFSSTDIAPTLNNISTANVGTYSLSVTYSDGCVGTATTSTTLNFNKPNVTINKQVNYGTAFISCLGNLVTFEPLNSTNADTYSWTGPNGFTSTERKVTLASVSANDVGTYTLTTTIGGNCAGTVTATSNIVIGDILPTSASINFKEQSSSYNGGTQCLGVNLILSASTSSSQITYTSYAWQGPNTFSSALANPVLINTQAASVGIYTVTVGYLLPCGTAGTITATANLIFSKTITLAARKQGNNSSSSSTFCPATNVELYVNSVSPSYAQIASYSWVGPNGFNSTAAVPLINNALATSAGTYTLTVNYASPCLGTSSATLSLTIANPTMSTSARRVGQTSTSSSFCPSTNIELTSVINSSEAITISSYSWTGPNGFSSTATIPQIANVQVANNGTYSLSAVANGTCAGTYTSNAYIFVENPRANISLGSASSTQCPGGNVTLSSTANGTTFGAGSTFSWSGPNGFSSTVQTPPSLTNLQAINSGTYALTVNYPSTFGCATSGTATSTLTLTIGVPIVTAVSRLQGTNTANTAFCVGTNVELFTTFNLTNPAPTVVSYSWVGPNGYSSTAAIPLLSNLQANSAGTYSVTVTFGGACSGTATATRTISITTPSVSFSARRVGQTNNSSAFCPATNIEFVAITNPNNLTISSYNWTGSNGFSSTATSPQIANMQVANNGTYSMSIAISGTCAGTYTSSSFIFVENPTAFISVGSSSKVQCPGGNITLNMGANGGNFSVGSTYSWTGPNGFSSTVQIPPTITNLQAANSGIYSATVNYPSTYGCATGGTVTSTTKLAIGNTAANILPNQAQTVASGANFSLTVELLGGTPPFNFAFSNGTSLNGVSPNAQNNLIVTTSITSAQTITISSISSSCGVGTGTGSAVILIGIPCSPNINFTGTYGTGSVIYQQATNTVNSTQNLVLSSGAKLTFDAGKSIQLNPGFVANTGSVFRAFIDGCGNITN